MTQELRPYSESQAFPSHSRLFHELQSPSKVLAIKGDRVRIRSQSTGRTSVFQVCDVRVLKKGGE